MDEAIEWPFELPEVVAQRHLQSAFPGAKVSIGFSAGGKFSGTILLQGWSSPVAFEGFSSGAAEFFEFWGSRSEPRPPKRTANPERALRHMLST